MHAHTFVTSIFITVDLSSSTLKTLVMVITSFKMLVMFYTLLWDPWTKQKPLHLHAFITEKNLSLFLLFTGKQSGKHIPKICTLIMQYFIYKNADLQLLGFSVWMDRRHQKREEKKTQQATNKLFLRIWVLIYSFPAPLAVVTYE